MRRPDGGQPPTWQYHDYRLTQEVVHAIKSLPSLAWDLLTGSVGTLFRLQRVLRRSWDAPADMLQLGHEIDSACEFTVTMLTAAIAGMSESHPEKMAQILGGKWLPTWKPLERAVLRGLTEGDSSIADAAILWLISRPSRFKLGDGHEELYWDPARAVIQRYSSFCSEQCRTELEKAILAYHEPWERTSFEVQAEYARKGVMVRNEWGEAQNVLLSAIPSELLSSVARHRAATWRTKFGDPASLRPLNSGLQGGWVTSPIHRSKLDSVSDRQWIRILTTEMLSQRGLKWKQMGPEQVGEASLRHFADDLGHAARRNPKRFAALALRIPPTANSQYFSTLLRELTPTTPPENVPAWQPASLVEIEAIIEHVGPCATDDYVQAFCRVVQQREDGRWSDATVEQLLSCLNHPHPEPGQFTVHRQRGNGKEMIPDVEGTAINCVRGALASAVTALLWRRLASHAHIVATAERLLVDPHPAVRCEALGAVLPIFKDDPELAVRLVVAACDHEDDGVLQSQWLNHFIRYARAKHLTEIMPILVRMSRSQIDRVAEWGAAWITACWLDGAKVQEQFEACMSGGKAQRLGTADAVSDYAARGKEVEKADSTLRKMFDDVDSDIRSRAGRFFGREGALDCVTSPALALAFITSNAYVENPRQLLHPLSDYTGDIRRYADVVLGAGEVLARKLAENTRDIRQRNAFAGNELSQVLLRLYETAYGSRDADLQNRCLDCWDMLLRHRVGITENHLRLLDD